MFAAIRSSARAAVEYMDIREHAWPISASPLPGHRKAGFSSHKNTYQSIV
jgi:hypothetical protein